MGEEIKATWSSAITQVGFLLRESLERRFVHFFLFVFFLKFRSDILDIHSLGWMSCDEKSGY